MDIYLGQKGYTISKSIIPIEQEEKIRNELMVKAYIPKSVIQSYPFPIYRESKNKFYLPRFYGIDHFLKDPPLKIKRGEEINLNFNGKLRDYQERIVNKYVDYVKDEGGGLLEIDTGMGKTIMALNIISRLNVKTLIIVHKEFLVDQWIERIQEFLPEASIGKIQGKKIDIEGKSIVIGMLQSLSMKSYEQSTFESFGFTVIDEVHHLGAEVFCQALFKIVTRYVLGLSATMDRKDGLTKVFKMFIGDIIHKEKRDTSNANVIVKAYDYKNDDEEFNEIKYDFRGNPQYSTMISKLCDCDDRSEFIIKLIKDELKVNDNKHIIVLGHNKSLLNYLYNAISSRNISSVGYYVGGMKKEQLKESESKKVIIATYSMASEGLDIKSLNTLVMATPKTDIVQSVGRILRSEHGSPTVIDVVDKHDLFVKQYYKRRAFYKKQNYKIIRNLKTNKEDENEEDKIRNPLQGKCFINITNLEI